MTTEIIAKAAPARLPQVARQAFGLTGGMRRAAFGLAVGLAVGATAAGSAARASEPAGMVELTTVGSSMSSPPDGFLDLAPRGSVRPRARPHEVQLPDLRWDHVRGSDRWTRAVMTALDTHGTRLVDTVPSDIEQWCPAYPDAPDWERKAFWAGLLSTLSKHESTWRANAVGGGGLWYGLVQILPATARGYGCQARTGEALKDGALNMSCAIRILNRTVPRDGVVSRGMRGVAADWGPFHSARKREDMRAWLVRQPFCQGMHRSMRPVMRPTTPDGPSAEPDMVPLFVSWELDKSVLMARPAWGAELIDAAYVH